MHIRDSTEKTAENAEIAEIYSKNPGKSAQSAAFFSELIRDFTKKNRRGAEIVEIYSKNPGKSA